MKKIPQMYPRWSENGRNSDDFPTIFRLFSDFSIVEDSMAREGDSDSCGVPKSIPNDIL